MNKEHQAEKTKCRCYINAKYNSKTAWRTGKLPKPCPIPGHDEDLKEHQAETGERIPAREIVCIGWDGQSKPIYRYRDELDLPDYQQVRVARNPKSVARIVDIPSILQSAEDARRQALNGGAK